MAKFTQWRNFWKRVRKNWSVKHLLIIRNETTHHDSFTFLLSPRNIFVTVMVSAVVLVALTAVIIAFTPLRYYIPGYTTYCKSQRKSFNNTCSKHIKNYTSNDCRHI